LHWAAPPGTLPTPWKAGFIGIGWTTEDFTQRVVQQREWTVVPGFKRFRSKAFSSVPGRSVMGSFCNIEVDPKKEGPRTSDLQLET
jgi:hypothetical protein